MPIAAAADAKQPNYWVSGGPPGNEVTAWLVLKWFAHVCEGPKTSATSPCRDPTVPTAVKGVR